MRCHQRDRGRVVVDHQDPAFLDARFGRCREIVPPVVVGGAVVDG